jgi:hypothetical protein
MVIPYESYFMENKIKEMKNITTIIPFDSYFIRWVEFTSYYLHYNEAENEYYLTNSIVGACLFTEKNALDIIEKSVKPFEYIHYTKELSNEIQ